MPKLQPLTAGLVLASALACTADSTSRFGLSRLVAAGEPTPVPGQTSAPERAFSRLPGWTCELVSDRDVKLVPRASMPGYLEPIIEPTFGTRIVRVTDPNSVIPGIGGVWGDVARHHYFNLPAWNADGSLLLLDRGTSNGRLFLDGATYEVLMFRAGPAELDLSIDWNDRWHPTEPDLRIYASGNEVGTWNVRTGTYESTDRFDRYEDIHFGDSANATKDNRIVIEGTDLAGRHVAFAYDFAHRKKFPDLDLTGVDVDSTLMSASGDYIVVAERRSDRSRVYDLYGNQVGPYWWEYGRPSHYDLTLDENGDDVAVGVSKSAPDKGLVIKRRLRDGGVTALTRSGYASATSTRNTDQPGWAFVSYGAATDWPPYHDEVVAVNVAGSGEVVRLFHTRRAKSRYVDETHPSVSPDGTKIIWASNWGEPDGPVAAFVTEICPTPSP